ncbi:MAG: O-antigen ligase family protein [Bacteroidota bacterium]|nr:O-antigen ligase family protein [Bacteroidota bacterium]
MMERLRIQILGLYILLIPFDNFKIFPFSISSIIGIIYILLCISRDTKFNKQLLLEVTPFLLSFIIITCSTFINSENTDIKKGPENPINAIILYFIMVIVLLLTVSQEVNFKYFNKIITYLFVSVSIASLTGIYELYMVLFKGTFVFGQQFIQYFPIAGSYLLRIRGSYFDPNYFSFLPIFGIICANWIVKSRSLKLIINLIFIILILTTISRMAIICLIIYYAIIFIPKQLFWRLLAPLILIALPLSIYLLTKAVGFFIDFNPGSSNDRFEIISGSIKMFISSPIWGYGFNVRSPVDLDTHNSYLQILLYGGLIAFFSIFIPVTICYLNIKNLKSENEGLMKVRFFLISSFFPFIGFLFFLSYLMIKLFWIYLLILFLGKNLLYSSTNSDTRLTEPENKLEIE